MEVLENSRRIIIGNINANLMLRSWKLQDLNDRMVNEKGEPRAPGFVSNTLKRPGLPPLAFLIDAARVFEIDVAELVSDYFEKFARKISRQIVGDSIKSIFSGPVSLHELLNWHAHNGGKLVDWDKFQDHVDVYGAPTDDDIPINLLRMGKESLAAETIGVFQPAAVRRKLSEAPASFVQGVAADHREVIEKNEPMVDVIDMDIRLETGPRVKRCFARIQLPLDLGKNGKGVMTLAKSLPLGVNSVTVEQLRSIKEQA